MVSYRAALVADAVCSSLTLLVCGSRIGSNFLLRQPWDVVSSLVLLSMLVLVARTVTDTLYLHDLRLKAALHDQQNVPSEQLSQLKRLLMLILASRVLVTTFYWLQVTIMLTFYTRLLGTFHRSWRMVITTAWILVPLTYTMVILATFLECRPFHLYWQVLPPSNCQTAYIQVFLQCISNLVLDCFLLAIAVPILQLSVGSFAQQTKIVVLCCLGLICICITSIRVGLIKSRHSSQELRSLWASIQALVSAFVANSPAIYGNAVLVLRNKRRKSSAATIGPIAMPISRSELQKINSRNKPSPFIGTSQHIERSSDDDWADPVHARATIHSSSTGQQTNV